MKKTEVKPIESDKTQKFCRFGNFYFCKIQGFYALGNFDVDKLRGFYTLGNFYNQISTFFINPIQSLISVFGLTLNNHKEKSVSSVLYV